MITPHFRVSQDNDHVYLFIHAPYTNLKEVEYFSNESDFRFVASPYFLRLNLPGLVEESEGSDVHYDLEKGDFTVKLQKKIPGENFKDLDLLSVLLAPNPQKTLQPKITLEGESTVAESEGEDSSDEWFLEQTVSDNKAKEAVSCYGYGFANKATDLFRSHEAEMMEIVDIRNADLKDQEQRRREREVKELEDFNEDHYLADLMDPLSLLLNALKMAPPYLDSDINLTTEEEDYIISLPKKSYLVSKVQKKILSLTVVGLVYSWAYDRRVTEGDHCIESGWAIAKVCPVLSYFEDFEDLRFLLVACVRRSITYPMLRSWDLSLLTIKDTSSIFRKGKLAILKCLLKVRKLFMESDPRYILNQLYLDDLCVWIQFVKEEKIKLLADAIEKCEIKKSDMNLNLDELEYAAKLVAEEEREIGEMSKNLIKIKMEDSDDIDPEDIYLNLDELEYAANLVAEGEKREIDPEDSSLSSFYSTDSESD
ncbi:protein SHQ1 homolog [Artemia franciscana]|uniref:protein SHQ1 homolog n=1 Tax=Artemia franciscana TaxID=6661 RepID=UPI0032DB549D